MYMFSRIISEFFVSAEHINDIEEWNQVYSEEQGLITSSWLNEIAVTPENIDHSLIIPSW